MCLLQLGVFSSFLDSARMKTDTEMFLSKLRFCFPIYFLCNESRAVGNCYLIPRRVYTFLQVSALSYARLKLKSHRLSLLCGILLLFTTTLHILVREIIRFENKESIRQIAKERSGVIILITSCAPRCNFSLLARKKISPKLAHTNDFVFSLFFPRARESANFVTILTYTRWHQLIPMMKRPFEALSFYPWASKNQITHTFSLLTAIVSAEWVNLSVKWIICPPFHSFVLIRIEPSLDLPCDYDLNLALSFFRARASVVAMNWRF